FIFNTDVFYFKCSDKKKAKKPVLRRFNDNMKRILSIADEEIILAGYKKHLFLEENTSLYVEWAIKEKMISILPCLSAYS
ncbi:MAG: hypothetical protein K6B28_06530, partial [Lachnospiraceae bacterium]|nr:hypothetical protein [Lachnospiraceae bacterium]